jgi:hypothetical protein
MADKKNAAKPMPWQSQTPVAPPRFAHTSDCPTDQTPAFLIATPSHSKNAVTTIKYNDIAFSNRNINPAVAVRKTAAKTLLPRPIFAADFARKSSRTAGF